MLGRAEELQLEQYGPADEELIELLNQATDDRGRQVAALHQLELFSYTGGSIRTQ
jgi:hypothetical protein